MVGGFSVWPAMIDVVSHEHDIRGTLGPTGRPRLRRRLARRGLAPGRAAFSGPVAHHGRGRPASWPARPARRSCGCATSRFEALRWRMGRRSRAPLAALGWSGDPAPVLDRLAVFEPAAHDVVE